MRKSNFALRLQPSLLDEARKLAEAEGVALNQLINVAVAEKVSALRTESYLAERAARADMPNALRILKRAGKNRPPDKGDDAGWHEQDPETITSAFGAASQTEVDLKLPEVPAR